MAQTETAQYTSIINPLLSKEDQKVLDRNDNQIIFYKSKDGRLLKAPHHRTFRKHPLDYKELILLAAESSFDKVYRDKLSVLLG